MTPDHDAAKKRAGSLGPENTFGVCGPDMLNLARAYLDLVAREQHAVRLLQRTLTEIPTSVALHFDIDNFLWERG